MTKLENFFPFSFQSNQSKNLLYFITMMADREHKWKMYENNRNPHYFRFFNLFITLSCFLYNIYLFNRNCCIKQWTMFPASVDHYHFHFDERYDYRDSVPWSWKLDMNMKNEYITINKNPGDVFVKWHSLSHRLEIDTSNAKSKIPLENHLFSLYLFSYICVYVLS